MRRKFHLSKPKKCPKTGKTKFSKGKDASRVMMRTWSHDTSMNIYEYHVYLCPDCKSYHFGNKKHYEKSIQNTVPTPTQPAPVAATNLGDGVNPSSAV
jgi:hypothetical protein